MRLLSLPASLSVLAFASALPSASKTSKPLPLLIWHGLGDRYDADGLHSVGELAQEIHPDTYVHYIRLDDNGDNDRSATFFGNVTEQVAQVCEDILNNKELRAASQDAMSAEHNKKGDLVVDALGFSQGGQFLRGLLQRCDGLQMRSLITFGSQHNGIAEVKACGTWDFLCKSAIALMKSNAWTPYVQSHVVVAQYFRTVNASTGLASEEYLENSNFLADINNEREVKNATYKERLEKGILGKFVMFVFEEDTTVIPLESGWFDEVVIKKNETSGEDERIVMPLKERTMYKEDWIGLKALDEQGKLVFKTTPGDHMQLDDKVLKKTFEEYLGSYDRTTKEDDEEGEAAAEDEKIVFDCLKYQPSYLAGWWWEIRGAWEGMGHVVDAWRGWGRGGLHRQGL